jgi:hypothetical protein
MFITGCEYIPPGEPSRPHGLSKYKHKQNSERAKETPGFLKNFIPTKEEKEAQKAAAAAAPEATAITLPNFKGDYIKKLRSKYPLLDISKIEDKDLMGMLEVYSQELNKIKARLQ